MLKHVQISPLRNRSDSLSIRSSISCTSSLCGSPEPSEHIRTPSRASSYCSLTDAIPQTTIKVYTACLRIDIEYKTLGVQWDTTSKEVVGQILRRCKMRQRDPRLFYLSMEVTVRRAGVRTVLVLDEEARPAILQACHPKGDSRFCLQLKPGGLIRVHTSALQATSLYKSLVISEETSSDELLGLLLACYKSNEPIEQFSLYEVCTGQEYQRKLHPDDLPLRAQQQRLQKGEQCHFLVRKNPHYPRRKHILLPPIIEKTSSTTSVNLLQSINSSHSIGSNRINLDLNNNSIPKLHRTLSNYSIGSTSSTTICKMCKNNFKSCEFCMKNVPAKLSTRSSDQCDTISVNSTTAVPTSYNPVYSIREIRTVCHSFSSLGIDKKLLDVESNNRLSLPTMETTSLQPYQALSNRNSIVSEAVNNNPSKGFGKFIYI